MVKSWETTTNEGLHGKIMGKPTKNRCSHGKIMGKPNKNPPACRRVAWILLARSCTICFVFVLSRLSPWRRFLPRLTWTHPLSFRWLFPLFLCLPSIIDLLRRFLYPILDPLAFVPNTFYTHNLSEYGLFQSRSQYGLFQNPGQHTCFGLNLNRGLNKANVFASTPSFAQRAVLHKNCVIHKHNVLHKNHDLAGPAQGLFAAYRIALSMVAGGTRWRRLNRGLHGKTMGKPNDKWRFTWEIDRKPNKNRGLHEKIMGKHNDKWRFTWETHGLHGKFMGKPSNNKCSHKKITGKPYKKK